ncbi:hypothetical protein VPH35_053936 [Triticum aestivum]
MDPPGERSASRASHHVSGVPTENVFAGAIVPASVDVVSVPAIQSRGVQHMDQPSTLVPLTMKQVTMLVPSTEHGGALRIHGAPVTTARLLGRMLKRRDMTDEIDFILADGTGAIQVFNDKNQNNKCSDGDYVIVNGCIKAEGCVRHVRVYSLSDIRRMELAVAAHEQSSPVSDRGNRLFDDFLRVFYHPGILQLENGASFTLIQSQTGADAEQLRCVIGAHVAMGNLFTTINDDHYKCSFNG